MLVDYRNKGQVPATKEQIVEMALKGSGIRDTVRVLQISATTVLLHDIVIGLFVNRYEFGRTLSRWGQQTWNTTQLHMVFFRNRCALYGIEPGSCDIASG